MQQFQYGMYPILTFIFRIRRNMKHKPNKGIWHENHYKETIDENIEEGETEYFL
jgi:hypothetical protein